MKGVGAKTNNGESRVGPGHNMFVFIMKKDVPKGAKVTYARFCCDIRPQKEQKHRMRLTVGSDRLQYDGETSTEVSSMETFKIHVNHTISTEGARYYCGDIGNMYTNSRLPSPEYMRIHIRDITQEIIDEYNVMDYVDEDGYVYCKISGALYGLAQSGYIANKDLEKHLKPFGYYPSKTTAGLWHHKTRPITFTLIVDDFGNSVVNKEDADHLVNAIEEKYPLKIDWTGSKYAGIDLEWYYDEGYVILSMKGYVQRALKQFLHEARKAVHGPTKFDRPEYGKKVQYMLATILQNLSTKN